MNNLSILLVGGALPSFLWGLTAILQRQSSHASTGPAHYLIAFGLTAASIGGLLALFWRPASWTISGVGLASAAGGTFAIGAALISFALFSLGAPVSRLAPLWSCNVLVTVAISLIFLGEAGSVDFVKLFAGTVLIVGGVVLVSHA